VRDDHLGSLSIDLVALAKCAAEQFLLRAGAPGQGRDDPRQRNKESRPTAEGERFAHGEQCKAQIDGVSHEAIRAGCDEAGALICFGREAPSGTKLGPGSDDEGGAASARRAPDSASSSAVKPAGLLEKIRSERKNRPKAVRFATSGARSPRS
jgi:hypothetical protein